MKFALIGAAAIVATAFATPVLAQDAIANPVIASPRYCAQFYPNGNCLYTGPGNPYAYGSYDRDGNWRNAMAMQGLDNSAYRYHGGPKYND